MKLTEPPAFKKKKKITPQPSYKSPANLPNTTMGVRRSWASRGGWTTLLVLLVVGAPASRALSRRSAAADPTPVAKPNLAALSGLGGLSALAGECE